MTFSESEERRALMLPQELKAMGNETEIILYEGLEHPVKAEKIRYYKDKYFTDRLIEKVTVKPLTIVEGGKPVKKEIKTTVAAVALAGLAACAPGTPTSKAAPVAQSPAAEPHEEKEKPEWVRKLEALPPVPKPEPLDKTRAQPTAEPEPSAAILEARKVNGTLGPDELKARIFRYIDSLQRLEDTHIDNIQKQLGLVIPPAEGREEFRSRYFDDLTDGGRFSVSVRHPQGEDATYGLSVFNHNADATPRDTPCRYTVDEFSEMLLARGFIDRGWGGKKLGKGFRKRLGRLNSSVVLWPYSYQLPNGSYETCVAQISIGMGVHQE